MPDCVQQCTSHPPGGRGLWLDVSHGLAVASKPPHDGRPTGLVPTQCGCADRPSIMAAWITTIAPCPVGSSAAAPATSPPRRRASAVGLTVVPEHLPQLSEWCLDEGQSV